MTINLNIFGAIMKNRTGGDSNGTLVITMLENRCTNKDTNIAEEVV